MALTPIVTKTLSTLTMLSDILIGLFLLVLILRYVFRVRIKFMFKIWKFITKRALFLAFIVAIVATLGSLYYSEIAGYEPCRLCWFQRIFMYPLVILLGVALIKKAHDIAHYVIPMSLIGAGISIHHYIIQRLVYASSCSAEATVPCTVKYTFTYGYITIPMMALTGFIMVIILTYYHLRKHRGDN
jgi:disulfide bond formation protein DsbB